ncbi:hypothetical protein ACQ4PT_064787 [Festuca glaucescens]
MASTLPSLLPAAEARPTTWPPLIQTFLITGWADSKVLNEDDVFLFLEGLIHFQFNPNPYKLAPVIAALSSQNPGAITIANAVFGSKPIISDDVLAKAFQVDKKTMD